MRARIATLVTGLLFTAALHAHLVLDDNALRSQVVVDPHGAITSLRQQLAQPAVANDQDAQDALLWWLGTAAINVNDDAALSEATSRLQALAQHHDAMAAAERGFLMARHNIANGVGDGVGDAVQAADKVQDITSPRLMAWIKFQLCDAYALGEDKVMAVPTCAQAVADYKALNDTWGMADAENDEGIALFLLGRYAESATQYELSRRHFAAHGADQLVKMVGDNLSGDYLKLGRPREALALSSASLVQEQAGGRVSDALFSEANIAEAYAQLGQLDKANAMMAKIVAQGHAAGLDGQLTDLLRMQSRLAERAGHLRQALAAERGVVKLYDQTDTPALRAIRTELEQRYAAHEKALRIRELEHENRIKDLALKAARAEAAQHREVQQRQRLTTLLAVLAAAGSVLIAALLFLLWRVQKKHSVALREQALHDPLTGIENRRAFLQRASALVGQRRTGHDPMSVLMLLDFDHFKRINDSAGHPQGDRVLVIVANFLRGAVQDLGHVARIGGEEFAVLCPQLGAEAAMRLAERLRAGVSALPLPIDTAAIGNVTVSIGVALFDGERCHDLDSWLRAADAAMYSAKSFGRDRVVASVLVP